MLSRRIVCSLCRSPCYSKAYALLFGSNHVLDANKCWLTSKVVNGRDMKTQIRPSSGTAVHLHMPILRVASALDESASAWATRASWPARGPARGPRAGQFVRFWASGDVLGEQSFQNVRFHAQAPMNHRAKFDAASFIHGGKKSSTVQTHKITNKQ